MTLACTVTIRSPNPDIPPCPAAGFVPYEGCPLAVTHPLRFESGEWLFGTDWQIVHVPTGFNLKGYRWKTRAEALAALERCEPTFPAWPLANGSVGDVATLACWSKFKAAVKK